MAADKRAYEHENRPRFLIGVYRRSSAVKKLVSRLGIPGFNLGICVYLRSSAVNS
jgi:hypothetical protein